MFFFTSRRAMQKKVAIIHREFYGASDFLQKEHERLNNSQERGQRLSNLGFTSTKESIDHKKLTESLHLMGYIERYRIHYPNHKFIDESQVKRICEKYKLVCGEVRDFIGTVPEKNLREIENFFFNQEDVMGVGYRIDRWSGKWESAYRRANLMICAPQHDFKMNNMRKLNGYRLVEDPVVLQPVPGGYIVLTAWGPEASDEDVANHYQN